MERSQALKTLRLDGSADGRTVESAYWNLVRRAQQKAEQDIDALAEVEELNQAYGTLAPEARRLGVKSKPAPDAGSGVPLLDWFVDWVSAEALRTRLRWPHRNPEIALIGGGATLLMLLALGSGASLVATFAGAAVVCIGIWAPWRKPD
jgi:hypothetical protein